MGKRFLIVSGMVLALSLGLVGVSFADNGPHGGYTATSDACAGCHRAHTASGASLLNNSTATASDKSGFCFTCHDGNGAYTDVVNGIFADFTPGAISETTVLSTGAPLKGGGFTKATMDSGMVGSASSISVTSKHVINGGSNTVWGSTATGAADVGVTGVALTCTNCHNPHGRAGAYNAGTGKNDPTYRLLKGSASNNPALYTKTGVTITATPVDVADDSAGNQTYWITSTQYYGVDYASRKATLSDWCAQCHNRYEALSTSGSVTTTAGSNDIYKYRHAATGSSNGYGMYSGIAIPGCLSCHVAHGTSASMGSYSSAVAWPTGGDTIVDPNTSRSSLLRLNNRGVCEQCHGK